MDFVFVPYPAVGHVAPMLAVAATLAGRSMRVRMITDARFAAAARSAGVSVVEVDSDLDVRVPAGWGAGDFVTRGRLYRGRRRLASAMAAACAREIGRMTSGVVVVDPHMAWARTLRLPARVRAAWLCTTTGRRIQLGRNPVLVNGLPELFDDPAAGDRVRFVGPLPGPLSTPDPGLPWERLRDRRLLVAAAGTVFTQPVRQVRDLVAAFADSDWMVVLASGRVPVRELGPIPANVVVHPWIPQAEVLAHAEVFLTHGGMNSVLEAIGRGVPMVFRPRSAEQRRTARGLEELGAGKVLAADGDIRCQIEWTAANPRVRESMARLRKSLLAAPTLDDAADELLTL